LSYRLVRWLAAHGVISAERLEAARRKNGSADYRAAEGVMRDILVRVIHESYEDELRAIECPVDLVWGRHDQEVPLTIAERAETLLRQGTLTVVEDAGHALDKPLLDGVAAKLERTLC